jgi:hypothetical protein
MGGANHARQSEPLQRRPTRAPQLGLGALAAVATLQLACPIRDSHVQARAGRRRGFVSRRASVRSARRGLHALAPEAQWASRTIRHCAEREDSSQERLTQFKSAHDFGAALYLPGPWPS